MGLMPKPRVLVSVENVDDIFNASGLDLTYWKLPATLISMLTSLVQRECGEMGRSQASPWSSTASKRKWTWQRKIATLAGDGIGPEIMWRLDYVLAAVAPKIWADSIPEDKPFGGCWDAASHPIPQDTLKAAKGADAILLAAIGSPEYDNALFVQNKVYCYSQLNLFANIRPVRGFLDVPWNILSPLNSRASEGKSQTSWSCAWKLTGGIYFGDHTQRRYSTRYHDYSAEETVALCAASQASRKDVARKWTSVTISVLATSKLYAKWQKVKEFPDVSLRSSLCR